jgi:hypothetical protein
LRPLVFVKYYDKASTLLGADQISQGLRERGHESHSIYPDRIAEFRDSIMIFIKTSKLSDLIRARRQGNTTVLDIHDTVVFKRRIKNSWAFDGLLFRNSCQFRDFGRSNKNDRMIYLHWDPRFQPHVVSDGQVRITYLGDRRSLRLWNQLPGVTCYDDDYFNRAKHFNCHLSIRQPGREFRYKPGIKVSTAAACGAVLITTADQGATELLGSDYPFYSGHEINQVRQAIQRIQEAPGGPEWNEAQRRLREVRQRTCLDRILDDYISYAESF